MMITMSCIRRLLPEVQVRKVLPVLLAVLMILGCSKSNSLSTEPLEVTAEEGMADRLEPDGSDLGGWQDELAPDVTELPDPESCDPRLLSLGQVRAKPVVCEAELPGGPNAIGRVGDYLLENSRVRFVIRAGAGHTFVGMDGGNVVDADLARPPGAAGNDRLQEIIPLFSFNSAALESLEFTNDYKAGEAVLSARGPAIGVPYLVSLISILPVLDGTITNEYVLKADSRTLILRTRISWNGDPGDSSVIPIDGFFASGVLQEFKLESNLGSDEPLPALVSYGPGISYGFLGSKGYEMTVLGAVALAMGASVKMPADGELVVERYLVVGDGSVSSITDELARLSGLEMSGFEGCVEPNDQAFADQLEVAASTLDGAGITRFTVNEQGCFAGDLPMGMVKLEAVCAGCIAGEPILVQIEAGESSPGEVKVPGTFASGLQVQVTDKDGGAIPARLTVEPNDGGQSRILLAWPPNRSFPLPPGSYRITATRGFEYERVVVDEVELTAGDITVIGLELERSVATPGAIAADFHIHSENSVDSFVPLTPRVRSIAAEGVEFAVASDHDFVTDYGPTISADKLGEFLATSPGEEMSSVQAGHMNCWPVAVQPQLSGNGALAWFGLSPGAVVNALRQEYPGCIVQVNHPRFQNESTFDLIEFDPLDGLAHADPEELGFPAGTDLNELDFDAMEVFNGIGDEDLDEQLNDWYSLLNLGRTITATAGGDSHTLDAFPGNPRNLLFVGHDDPAVLTVDEVNEAVRQQRVLVTSGPYVEAGLTTSSTAQPSLPGDLVSGVDGDVKMWVKVQAPTWMEVTELTIIRNGNAEQVIPIDDPGDPVLRSVIRFEDFFPIQVDEDSWFVIRVRGTVETPNLANHIPLAITNPFYLDVHGDGQFDPPGL
jgi:hypothetical protein